MFNVFAVTESFTENVTESFSSIIFFVSARKYLCRLQCSSFHNHRSTHRHLVEFSWQISMRKNQFHHSFRRRGLLQAKERWKMSLKYDRINVKSKNHKSFESFSFICGDFHCHDHFLFRSFTQRFFFIPGFEKKAFFMFVATVLREQKTASSTLQTNWCWAWKLSRINFKRTSWQNTVWRTWECFALWRRL